MSSELCNGADFLFIQDLVGATPISHGDYDLLHRTLKLAQNFLNEANGSSPKDNVCIKDDIFACKLVLLHVLSCLPKIDFPAVSDLFYIVSNSHTMSGIQKRL